jgi:hypothetical protein
MVLLPGCKCCKSEPCWKCNKKDCAGIVKYWAEVADQYEDSFRITGYGIDTDARPPDRQTGDSTLEWDGSTSYAGFDANTSGVVPEPSLRFFVQDYPDYNSQKQFILSIFACVMIAGEKNYRFEFYNLSVESPELSIVKHVSQDGVETVVNTGNFISRFEIPMTTESPFFLGQYIAEYSDGSNVVIELRDTYKLLIPYKEYQCFDAQPDEEGWIATGDCSATEEECAESCPPPPLFCECNEPNLFQNLLKITITNVREPEYLADAINFPDAISCQPEYFIPFIEGREFSAPFNQYLDCDDNICRYADWEQYDLPEGPIGGSGQGGSVFCSSPQKNPISSNVNQRGEFDSCANAFMWRNPISGNQSFLNPKELGWSGQAIQTGNVDRICEFSNSGLHEINDLNLNGLSDIASVGIGGFWVDQSVPPESNSYLKQLNFFSYKADFTLELTTPTGARTMTTTKTTGGPGTELKRLLGSFGIQSKEKGCGCRSMQKKMDKPGWAVSHKKEIIDHLAAEAKKRRLPFIRLAAEKLVDLAIRRAEKK